MAKKDPLKELHVRAVRVGVPITRVFERAGLSRATWSGWKNGTKPKPENMEAVKRVLSELEAALS